jgi:hypothetical protein
MTDILDAKEKQKKAREKTKERYKTDPEYRKKVIADAVAYQRKRRQIDLEYRKKRSEYQKKSYRKKCETDPEYRKKQSALQNARHRKRYATDTEYREKHKKKSQKSYEKQLETNLEHYKARRDKNWKENKEKYYKKRKEKFENDSEYAEKCRQYDRKRYLRGRTVEAFKKQLTKNEIKDLKRRFIETIEKSAFIGITAKHLGITESRAYYWMQKDAEFANAVKAAQARTAERVGLALISKALTENDTSAQIFICKTLGKSLGFDEKQPIVNINMNNQPDMDLSGLTLEEKEQFLNLLRKSKQSKQIEQDTIDV